MEASLFEAAAAGAGSCRRISFVELAAASVYAASSVALPTTLCEQLLPTTLYGRSLGMTEVDGGVARRSRSGRRWQLTAVFRRAGSGELARIMALPTTLCGQLLPTTLYVRGARACE